MANVYAKSSSIFSPMRLDFPRLGTPSAFRRHGKTAKSILALPTKEAVSRPRFANMFSTGLKPIRRGRATGARDLDFPSYGPLSNCMAAASKSTPYQGKKQLSLASFPREGEADTKQCRVSGD